MTDVAKKDADAFREQLKARGKIQKLMALAAGNSNPNEARQAMAYARRLGEKHGIDITTMRPAVELSPEEKRARFKQTMGGYFGTIQKAYPGKDDEDYSKYAKGRKRDDDDRKLCRGLPPCPFWADERQRGQRPLGDAFRHAILQGNSKRRTDDMTTLNAVQGADGRFAVPPKDDPYTRLDYLRVVLHTSVSLPVMTIASRYNDADRAAQIEAARAEAMKRDPSNWSDVERRLFSPETLDS
jgi:Protein of unknown function (DUF2786)